MIHIVIELSNVDLQAVSRTSPISYQCTMHIFHALVNDTPLDTGVCIACEYMIPVLTQDVDNTVMDNPIRIERSNHYHPLFRLIDNLYTILTRLVGLIPQHIVEVGQVIVQVIIETLDLSAITLSFLGVILRTDDIGVLIEQGVNVSEFLSWRNEYLSCVSDIVSHIFKILIVDRRIVVTVTPSFLYLIHV